MKYICDSCTKRNVCKYKENCMIIQRDHNYSFEDMIYIDTSCREYSYDIDGDCDY